MKRKVNINRPQISTDEVNQHKNFDAALKTHLSATKPFFKKPWFLSGVVVATAVAVSTVLFLNNNNSKNTNSTVELQQLSAADSTDFNSDDVQPSKSCIAPPLEGLNVDYKVYKINAEKGGEFKHFTGSIIRIPANAFIDNEGNKIKGEVQIRYREFHDVAEIFVAGIPMTYDSAGIRYHFETAGMLQIEGYQNGNKLNILPDKPIHVKMVSEDNSPKYNLYELDTLKNNWACLGKDKIEKRGDSETAISMGIDDATKNILNPDIAKLEKQKSVLIQEKEEKIEALPTVPKFESKKPVKANPEKYTFDINVDPKEFPELAMYKGMLFEVGAENKNFNKSYYSVEWEDAVIKEGPIKNENYTLTLKKKKQEVALTVYPVFEGKNYEAALKLYQEKFEKYNTTLNKRKEDEQRIEEEYKAKVAAIQKKEEELIAMEKSNAQKAFVQSGIENMVFRTFTVSHFGVYNCDNPLAYPKGAMCNALLKDENGKQLRVYDIYFIDKKIRGIFTYYKNPVYKLSYNPTANNIIWTVQNGTLYYLLPEDFKVMATGPKDAEIKLKRVNETFKSVEELKTFFNI